MKEAINSRDETPTTLPPYCFCPQNNRRRRQATDDEIHSLNSTAVSNNMTNDEANSTDNNATTLTPGPPTTTWPITCICPEDEDEIVNNSTVTNSTVPEDDENNNSTSSNSNDDDSTNSTVSEGGKRRRRSLEEIEEFDKWRLSFKREKRGIKYRCNSTIVLGFMFLDMYDQGGIQGRKCCCPDYPGELFLFTATIDEPWINALADQKSTTFKSWSKMVDQEVRYLFLNKDYSDLMVDNLLKSVEFIGFKKLKGKCGVEFNVHLTRPHWDNDRRIENAFENLVNVYKNQSEEEENVLGKRVLGKFTKRDYVVDNFPHSHIAKRIQIIEEVNDDDLSGSGSGEEEPVVEEEGLPLIFLVAVPLGGLLILCIPFCIALRSKACLCRQCC